MSLNTKLNPISVIRESQVSHLLTIPESFRLAREAYLRLAKGEALSPERVLLSVPNRVSVFSMPAHVLGQKTVSVKIARLNPRNRDKRTPSVMATIYVYDSSTGHELAQIEANTLTALRTAASSAVATDLLAEKECETLGIIGTGTQAKAHVPALLVVRKFSRILVYSRSSSHRRSFALGMRRRYGVTATPVDSTEKVVESSQVLVLATNSQAPLFDGKLVQPRTHVNAVGAARPEAREVDNFLVRNSLLVVDSIAQALSSYGDILIPIREGRIKPASLNELGDLLAHPGKIKRKTGQVTLFKSGGIAVLDAMFADYVVSLARRHRSGKPGHARQRPNF